MHAYLLISKNNKERLEKAIEHIAHKNNSQILRFDLQKIEDVRELKKFVSLRINQKTAIVVDEFDSATPEAQNAFLKNLEEPQEKIIYILSANNLSSLLPTIQSRCEVVRLKANEINVVSQEAVDFFNGNVDYKLEFISKIKDRAEAVAFVENLILSDQKDKQFLHMEDYLNTIKNLKLNGNVALQLANLVVTMNSHGR